ncbi:MAG: DinB family protein [Bacteroidetes bacterium]|nr:DinB family protein [Bacteroidota bacterium]MBS1973306.1 DinB family protein [Bacteroidota bacterium]
MKKTFSVILLLASFCAYAQNKTAPALKSILLDQFRATHNKQEWFVPATQALGGLSAEQAMWRQDTSLHSIGQLVNHLIFWDNEELAKFKGEKPVAFNGNNDETFASFDKDSWAATVKKLDEVLTEWEKAIARADEKKLQSWYAVIANISTHNAYHIGQILYIRKLQKSWNPDKGVK